MFFNRRMLPWWPRQWIIRLQRRRPEFDPWVRKIPWRREWQPTPTPVLLLGEFHGQRSVVGYSPWGCKKLDMNKHISIYSLDTIMSSLWIFWTQESQGQKLLLTLWGNSAESFSPKRLWSSWWLQRMKFSCSKPEGARVCTEYSPFSVSPILFGWLSVQETLPTINMLARSIIEINVLLLM